MLCEMANSVDPDQTAPKEQSDLGLHCLHMPCHFVKYFGVGNFRTFTVMYIQMMCTVRK